MHELHINFKLNKEAQSELEKKTPLLSINTCTLQISVHHSVCSSMPVKQLVSKIILQIHAFIKHEKKMLTQD